MNINEMGYLSQSMVSYTFYSDLAQTWGGAVIFKQNRNLSLHWIALYVLVRGHTGSVVDRQRYGSYGAFIGSLRLRLRN